MLGALKYQAARERYTFRQTLCSRHRRFFEREVEYEMLILDVVIKLSTLTVSIQEAEKRLRELIGLAKQGDEIVIARDEQTKIKLVPVAANGW